MDPMGTIDSILTLIRTKNESYGPCGLENFFCNLMQTLIAVGMVLEIVIFESVNG